MDLFERFLELLSSDGFSQNKRASKLLDKYRQFSLLINARVPSFFLEGSVEFPCFNYLKVFLNIF